MTVVSHTVSFKSQVIAVMLSLALALTERCFTDKELSVELWSFTLDCS